MARGMLVLLYRRYKGSSKGKYKYATLAASLGICPKLKRSLTGWGEEPWEGVSGLNHKTPTADA